MAELSSEPKCPVNSQSNNPAAKPKSAQTITRIVAIKARFIPIFFSVELVARLYREVTLQICGK